MKVYVVNRTQDCGRFISTVHNSEESAISWIGCNFQYIDICDGVDYSVTGYDIDDKLTIIDGEVFVDCDYPYQPEVIYVSVTEHEVLSL